ncbi:MAG: hypothetical protein HYZ27_02815, partial [Deltaproteobacteria bacterium]|nr:hypothetical protein [Deltaproteobacteria bacterium]
ALLKQAAALEKALPRGDLDARSVWFDAQAQAHDKLGQSDQARALRLRRFLEEPISLKTPAAPPEGTTLTPDQVLARAEKLLDAHRNERVLGALEPLKTEGLTPSQRCRREFALGLTARKLRHYANAEKYLTAVTDTCRDLDLVRRAMYLNVKVISIRDGLRAVPVMDLFAKKFAGHSMVDDVLFWAGDLFERRQRWSEAEKYYKRIEAGYPKGDNRAEACWRQAWMAYRRGKTKTAGGMLTRMVGPDGCFSDRFDRARAHYWLGRFAGESGKSGAAHYRNAIDLDPLGYYGQLGLARLSALDAQAAAAITTKLAPPNDGLPAGLCAGFLERDPSFARGVELLSLGLTTDAAAELRAVAVPEQKVLADTHAAALGVAAKPAQALAENSAAASGCARGDALFLLTLLLDRAGAYREAHWRLRTDLGDRFDTYPSATDGALWRAAYPLAYRDFVEPAEQEGGLPPLFLQALAREESALDAQAV